jgi:DNA-binding MarR family transcriptional regulator
MTTSPDRTAPEGRTEPRTDYTGGTFITAGPRVQTPDPDPIDLERFLPYRLSVLTNLVSTTIADTYQRRFDLTIPEWRVIAVLSRHPGLSAAEVAELTRMDAVAVSRAVARLLRAGRLRRAVSPADRRRSVLRVSRAGAAVYLAVAPLALGYERELLAALDDTEQALLMRALDSLTERARSLAGSLKSSTARKGGAGRELRSGPRRQRP